MAIREILRLGNPGLYRMCDPVKRESLSRIAAVVEDLHDTMMDFRSTWGCGRAIAAPQIGAFDRLVYMHIDGPTVFINPVLSGPSEEMMELWDDCMSFPELLVRVRRHRSCTIRYRDLDWCEHESVIENDLSELLQHECDHLDGILTISRAIDERSIILRSERHLADKEDTVHTERSTT